MRARLLHFSRRLAGARAVSRSCTVRAAGRRAASSCRSNGRRCARRFCLSARLPPSFFLFLKTFSRNASGRQGRSQSQQTKQQQHWHRRRRRRCHRRGRWLAPGARRGRCNRKCNRSGWRRYCKSGECVEGAHDKARGEESGNRFGGRRLACILQSERAASHLRGQSENKRVAVH